LKNHPLDPCKTFYYKNRTVPFLPQNLEPGLAKELKKKLKEQIKQLEDRKKKWRHIRDEDTESYNDHEMQTWRKRLEEGKPQEYMKFHVAK